ncbi:hypothetical protein LCGC14_2365310 [marine sediment metagenome]|uniref:Uncharacterized protein n=1 Tax=marine sediment metagenome TaxID=412755 RepID=A0A0F9CSN3_9ZZZZ
MRVQLPSVPPKHLNTTMKLYEILDESYLRMGERSHREERHCLRKLRYPTLKQARHALLKCWQKGRKERSLYPCEYCNQFHLTKKKPEGIART